MSLRVRFCKSRSLLTSMIGLILDVLILNVENGLVGCDFGRDF